jgi:glutaredoxin
MSPTVTLYTRADCHLCADTEALLARLAPVFGLVVEKVDIASDPRLEHEYRWAIPVVALDGRELARAPIRAAALEDALRQALAFH